MHNYDQLVPDLSDLVLTRENFSARSNRQVSCKATSTSPSSSEFSTTKSILFNIPPVINNSALVRQRATAKDILAASSFTTGASLPLMIGNRSKCVVNLVSDSELLANSNSNPILISGPKNTALRAEQRKQNMVSVVRPVMNLSQISNNTDYSQVDNNRQSRHNKIEESSLWQQVTQSSINKSSVIDELMSLDNRLKASKHSDISAFDENSNNIEFSFTNNEQQARQQMLLFRREEYELNRSIKRHHRFVMSKIEERKRNLQIVQSVWAQKDFKHAIEKLVDLYHQGLVFTCAEEKNFADSKKANLSSLNSSLVVDVISVIILRPKLWNLEICQLLLPILVNDLLVQTSSQYESYVEVALKALKLILTHFSSVIKSTLESQKESSKLVGIDISREDRINKCANCYKLLLDAQKVLEGRRFNLHANGKFAQINRQLEQSFSLLQASIDFPQNNNCKIHTKRTSHER